MRTGSTFFVALLVAAAGRADWPISAPKLGPAPGWQIHAAVGSNGSDYVVAWEDRRGLRGAANFATRVDRDGAPSGDGGRFLGPKVDYGWLSVVPRGDGTLIFESVHGVTGLPGGLRMTRFTSAGPQESHLLTSEDLGSQGPGIGNRIVAAWNGKRYFVVATGWDVFGELIDDSFAVVKQAFPMQKGGGIGNVEAIATDGDTFLVAYRMEDNVLRASRVTSDGVVTQVPAMFGPAPRGAAMVWDGLHYFVVWSDGAIRGRFVNRDGTSAGDEMLLAPSGASPAIAWNGSAFLLAFVDAGNLAATRLDAAGRVVGRIAVTVDAAEQKEPAVVSASGRFLIAWEDNGRIRSVLLDGDKTSNAAALAQSLGHQKNPDIAVGDGEAAFAWEESGRVMFGRARFDGTPLDGAGIDLGAGTAPHILFNGDVYLVIWTASSLVARRVSRQGGPLDAGPFPIANGTAFRIAAATDGSEFLVVWSDVSGTVQSAIVRGEQVIAAGQIAVTKGSLSLGWDGAEFVLIFSDLVEYFHHLVPNGLIAIFLDRNGNAVTKPQRVAGSYPNAPYSAVVAGGNGTALVAYGRGPRVIGLRVDRSGESFESFELARCERCYDVAVADIAWTGSTYVVAYGDTSRRIDARGGVVVTVHLELLPPEEGSIQRAFFEVRPAPRSRAVRP